MAKISARGDVAAVKLRKPNGGLVVVTRRGRLLAQPARGAGYALVDAHWVRAGVRTPADARRVGDYLIANRYPGSEVVPV